MRQSGLVAAAVLVISAGATWGQQSSAPASTVAEKPFSLFGAGDIIKAANDLRAAAEALERLGTVAERIATVVGKTVTETSRNHAKMSAAFDPFGYKTAFETIRRQNRTIERLQKAEIRRLRKEVRTAKPSEGDGRKPKKNKRKQAAE